MKTNDKDQLTKNPLAIHPGKKMENELSEAVEGTYVPKERPKAQTIQETPQADPYAGYQKQMEDNYATTLADIRKRRQEVEQKYQPSIERQQKVMKIMALGKLLGQLGQLAGGGRGPVIKDKDPYQVNAWRQLEQTKNEQKYYMGQLDAEERAARQGMQQGLSRLNIEKAKASQRMAEMSQKYDLELKKMGANAELKAAFEQLKHTYAVELQNAKTAGQLAVVEANMKRDAYRLAQQAANSSSKETQRHTNKLAEIAAQGEENRKTKSTVAGGTSVTYNTTSEKGKKKGQNATPQVTTVSLGQYDSGEPYKVNRQ